jgi:hypothetical protein
MIIKRAKVMGPVIMGAGVGLCVAAAGAAVVGVIGFLG